MLKTSIDLLIYMKEQWKDIADYEVSDLGRVRNKKTKRILRLGKDSGGYVQVNLYNDGERKSIKIHRLVASTFIPNPLNLPQINHIDENKTNNNVENLEWCSAQYNIDYSQSKPVNQYSLDGIYIATYKSIKEASKQTGINQGDISCCCRGKYKTSGGFIWKYVN